ncbi:MULTISPECIES: ABC transporter permease [Paracoccus]|uniref:ABC transporter permease n=1 Tax=Paracoccus TaxID=265 RepID=UPI00048BC612|nr:ABC transporter permease [Paracoccus pantotrophus]MDF3856327.1 ABC transporter permease [Paracoccus pantotrophus]RDD96375.1 ABC transporter permease [Paracoccus pantotrophus]RNI16203.1 ABC transporter permease [Paracoccus pantotrophus]WGR65133.1 ABC transporter permease [Paracoccus pantotrophus]SFP07715.1 ribose transport system permease protein [Paracoccus pantotrophus]
MIRNFLGRTGPLLALVLLFLAGSLLSPTFLTSENLLNVLTRSSVIGIIAIGATFVITARGLDLSVGAMAALVAGLSILCMNALLPMTGAVGALILGLLLAFAFGGAAGLVNGGLVVWGRIDAFIVTLGTMGIMRSLITWMSDGGSISLDFALRGVGRPLYYGTVLGIPVPVLIFAALAILGEIAMTRLRFGRHVTAIGSNAEVARHSAIRVDRARMATYALQGLCVGLATLIYIPRLGAVTPSTGMLWELEAIAAVIIGGTALSGGYGRVWGTVAGVLILGLVANILNLTSFVSPHLNGAFQGAIIVIAVFLQRRSTSR